MDDMCKHYDYKHDDDGGGEEVAFTSFSMSYYDTIETCAQDMLLFMDALVGSEMTSNLLEATCGPPPTKMPTPFPTNSPTTSDTTTINVGLVLSATAAPTATDKSKLKTTIVNQLGLSEDDIQEFTVTYTESSSSSRRRHTRNLLGGGSWSVSFKVKVSLSSVGASSPESFQDSISSTMQLPSFSSAVTTAVPSVTGVDSITTAINTRHPTPSPTPM
jgi:hypothetical protein